MSICFLFPSAVVKASLEITGRIGSPWYGSLFANPLLISNSSPSNSEMWSVEGLLNSILEEDQYVQTFSFCINLPPITYPFAWRNMWLPLGPVSKQPYFLSWVMHQQRIHSFKSSSHSSFVGIRQPPPLKWCAASKCDNSAEVWESTKLSRAFLWM